MLQSIVGLLCHVNLVEVSNTDQKLIKFSNKFKDDSTYVKKISKSTNIM